jgi:hypothetical protein
VDGDLAANSNVWANEYVRDAVVATDLNSATGPQATSTAFAGVTGSEGAAAGPQVMKLLKLFTALRGRRYRGRIYFNVADARVAGGPGTVDATGLAHMSSWFSYIQTALASLTPASTLVIASRGYYKNRKTGVVTIWTPFSTAVSSALPESLVATQRRRVGR